MTKAMKDNFVVSVYKKVWIRESKSLYTIEPFVHHYLEINNELKKLVGKEGS